MESTSDSSRPPSTLMDGIDDDDDDDDDDNDDDDNDDTKNFSAARKFSEN